MPTPRLARTSAASAEQVIWYPQVRAGTCTRCGVINPHLPDGHFQYEYCNHFKGLGMLRCVYCDPSKDPNEVIRMSEMNVVVDPSSRPDDPVLLVWCDSYECSKKHTEKYNKTA